MWVNGKVGDKVILWESYDAYCNYGAYQYNQVAKTSDMLIDIWAQLCVKHGIYVDQSKWVYAAAHTVLRTMSDAQTAIMLDGGVEVEGR